MKIKKGTGSNRDKYRPKYYMNMIKFIMEIDIQRDGWMDLQMKIQLVLAVGV